MRNQQFKQRIFQNMQQNSRVNAAKQLPDELAQRVSDLQCIPKNSTVYPLGQFGLSSNCFDYLFE